MSINFFLILAQVGKIFTKKSKIRQKLIIKKVYNHGGENSGTLLDGIYSGGELENAEKLGSLKAT